MVKNVGPTDKMIRIVAGVVLLALALFFMSGAAAWIIGIIGVVLLATGVTQTCPAYSAIGTNTLGDTPPRV